MDPIFVFTGMFLIGVIIGYTTADYFYKMTDDKLNELRDWLLSKEYKPEDDEELSHYEMGWNRIIDKTIRKIDFLKDE